VIPLAGGENFVPFGKFGKADAVQGVDHAGATVIASQASP
jgi:hypothetical protein